MCGNPILTLLYLHSFQPQHLGTGVGGQRGAFPSFQPRTLSLNKSWEGPKVLKWLVLGRLARYTGISALSGAPFKATLERNTHVVEMSGKQNHLVLKFTFNPKQSLSFSLQSTEQTQTGEEN